MFEGRILEFGDYVHENHLWSPLLLSPAKTITNISFCAITHLYGKNVFFYIHLLVSCHNILAIRLHFLMDGNKFNLEIHDMCIE
jgi:hypothetical protein